MRTMRRPTRERENRYLRKPRAGLGGLSMGLAAAMLLIPSALAGQESGGPLAGVLRGEQVVAQCASCHPAADLALPVRSLHAQKESCLTCHHMGFENDPVQIERLRVEACASCHGEGGDLEAVIPGEDISHAGLADAPECTACHSVHDQPRLDEPAFGPAMSGSCSACHQEPGMVFEHGTVEEAASCTDCHATHQPQAVTSACLTCHEDAQGVHVDPLQAGSEGPECGDCHAVHDPRAAPVAAEVNASCQSCHETPAPAHAGVEEDAPSCVACHDFHGEGVVGTATQEMSQNCAECHEDEMAGFLAGGHATGFPAPGAERDAPDCVSCHTAHPDPDQPARTTRADATARCVACHSDATLAETYELPMLAGESYLKDFHGQTLRLQYLDPKGRKIPDVMICSDCHGAHEVKWLDEGEVAAVCLDCHESGSAALAGAWVGHERIGPRNGTLIWLTRLFYWFLIPFSLGGLIVTIGFHLRRERIHGARMGRSEGAKRLLNRLRGEKSDPQPSVVRFSLTERVEHVGSMMTFILLVVTGLPQIYSQSGFALGIIRLFGGIQMTRYIHRVLGVIFVVLMVTHLFRGVLNAIRKRRLPAMVPTGQDFLDMIQMVKHFVWGSPKPKVGKFDFAEKYEYWGLLLGGSLMATTGIVLLFPALLSQILPGILLTVAKVMHGLEGTFAVLVVVLWHSWGVILRPEIFPLDTTIFTGKMSVARLKAEHPLEYERIYGVTLPEEPEVARTVAEPTPDPHPAPG